MCLIADPHQTENLRHLLADLPRRFMYHFHGESYIFKYRLLRQQPEILKDGSQLSAVLRDLPVGQLCHFMPVYQNASLVCIDFLQNQLDKGGFPGAAGSHQKDKITFFNMYTYIVQPYVGLVSFRHMLKTNHILPLFTIIFQVSETDLYSNIILYFDGFLNSNLWQTGVFLCTDPSCLSFAVGSEALSAAKFATDGLISCCVANFSEKVRHSLCMKRKSGEPGHNNSFHLPATSSAIASSAA